MSKRRIYDDALYAHFITYSCHARRNLLSHDARKRIVLGSLNLSLTKYSAKCVGFVIMPNHVHAIVWFPFPRMLSGFMRDWKRRSSEEIRGWFLEHRPNYAKYLSNGEEAIWQPRYYAFEIYSDEKLREKVEYMHQNPIRAGLCSDAREWHWSSARWYAERRSVGVPIHWVE